MVKRVELGISHLILKILKPMVVLKSEVQTRLFHRKNLPSLLRIVIAKLTGIIHIAQGGGYLRWKTFQHMIELSTSKVP